MTVSRLIELQSSFLCSLGGQRNANRVSLVLETGPTMTVPFEADSDAARTILCVSVGEPRPIHPVSGTRQERFDLGPLKVEASQQLTLTNDRQAFRLSAGTIEPGEYRVTATIYTERPHFAEDTFSAITTVDIELNSPTVAETQIAHTERSPGFGIRVDDNGFFLADAERLPVEVARRVPEGTTDLMTLIGSTELGAELAQAGTFVPVWGMRPWVYRLASVGEGCRLPYGVEVTSPRLFPWTAEGSEVVVVPAQELWQWSGRIEDRWPRLAIPRREGALAVRVFVSGGYEPMDPTSIVGIVPTFVIERATSRTSFDEEQLLIGFDPFAAYTDVKVTRERLLIVDAETQ